MNAQTALLVASEARRANVAREPSDLDQARINLDTDGKRAGFRTALSRLVGRRTPAATPAG